MPDRYFVWCIAAGALCASWASALLSLDLLQGLAGEAGLMRLARPVMFTSSLA